MSNASWGHYPNPITYFKIGYNFIEYMSNKVQNCSPALKWCRDCSKNHANVDWKISLDFETFLIKISIEDLWQLPHPKIGVRMAFNFPNDIFGKFEQDICKEFRARAVFT